MGNRELFVEVESGEFCGFVLLGVVGQLKGFRVRERTDSRAAGEGETNSNLNGSWVGAGAAEALRRRGRVVSRTSTLLIEMLG